MRKTVAILLSASRRLFASIRARPNQSRSSRLLNETELPAAAPEELDELFHSIGLDRDYADLDIAGLVPSFDPLGEPDGDVFETLIRTTRPRIVIEVGVWTGGSLLRMFEMSRKHGCKTRFIAIDTWLGSNPELWFDEDERKRLLLVGGYPTMFRQFIVNVLAHEAGEDVFALPMTSTAAARVLRRLHIAADAIYIDGGHEEEEVRADVELYYDLLRPGGVLLGDDYHSRWPGVVRAVDSFAADRKLKVSIFGTKKSKWWLTKP